MFRYRRRHGRRGLQKQRKIAFLSLAILTVFLSVGYAAFSTIVTLNIKGNIKEKPNAAEMLIEDVKESTDTTDGLYYDGNNDEYYFKGANPNNYIEFNGEVWRIMSINSSGNLKIIKEDRIDLTGYSGVNSSDSYKGRFDASGATGRRLSGYCSNSYAQQYGCNAWAAMSSFANTGTGNYYSSGVVTADSELNTYLNTTYKSSLSDLSYVQTNMTWNVGHAGVYNDTLSVSELENMEKAYTWIGDIALPTKSEYIRAHGNTDCSNVKYLYDNRQNDTCKTTNYLYKSDYWYWLLSPPSAVAYSVFFAGSGFVSSTDAKDLYGSARPVLHLKSDVKLTGEGTLADPYRIVQESGGGSGGGGSVTPTPSTTFVYAFNTDEKCTTDDCVSNLSGYGIDNIITDGVSDYTQLSSWQNGIKSFLKYEINGNNEIQNAWGCAKYPFITEPVCLQGGNASYYGTASTGNRGQLTGLVNTFEAQNPAGFCTITDDYSLCEAESLRIRANDDGFIYTGTGTTGENCNIYDYDGTAVCN